MAASDATPFPIKNQAYRVTFPIFDNDGDLVTDAAGLDSEISKDGGTFADCTNEATQIAESSGMYYLDLTATEMNADTVAIIIKTTTTNAKTTPIVLYPAEPTDIPVNVKAISDDTGAADNLEADYDGTGYAKANSTVGTCTANSDMRGTNSAATAAALSTHDGKFDTVDMVADAIKAKTDLLPADPASETNVNVNETKINTLDTVADAVKVVTDKLADTLEDDVGTCRFTENALEQAPSGTGGDATAENQTSIITHLTDAKGTGFVKDTNSLVNVTSASPVNIDHDSTSIVNE